MSVAVTSIYAAMLALIGQFLGASVGALRGRTKISLGHGGDESLLVADRRHMNFVENVPMALILIALLELGGASAIWLHGLGASLVAARLVHPFGLSTTTMMSPARIFGAAVTALTTVVAAGLLLWRSFAG